MKTLVLIFLFMCSVSQAQTISATKTPEGQLRVTRQSPAPAPTTADYDLKFLYDQRAAITAQKAEQMKARDAELAEVNDLIQRAEKLGLKVTTKGVTP